MRPEPTLRRELSGRSVSSGIGGRVAVARRPTTATARENDGGEGSEEASSHASLQCNRGTSKAGHRRLAEARRGATLWTDESHG